MRNKFIDLFAGIGGFHIAASKNNLKLIMASEIDEKAKLVYEENFNCKIKGDIYKIDQIPKHNWLFGGFPCQPFSIGGKKQGLKDERGNLFFEILRFIDDGQPEYIILENVKGLTTNDYGKTWNKIYNELTKRNYFTFTTPFIYSPHLINIPQKRERVYIIAIKKSIYTKNKFSKDDLNIFLSSNKKKKQSVLENKFDKNLLISQEKKKVIKAWIDFQKNVKLDTNSTLIADFFNNNSVNEKEFADWKKDALKTSKKVYLENKTYIDGWKENFDVMNFERSHRIFEYRKNKKISENYVQFRPSGLRIIDKNTHPTITTISSQILIDPVNYRKISINELKRLQSFPNYYKMHDNYNTAVKQIGNSVNITIVELLIKFIIKKYEAN